MWVDGERWPSNGIRRPGLRAFAVGTIWEESRVCHCTVGQAKICARTAYGDRARELDVGPIFLVSNRSTLYLVLATDGLTLNMNIYSDRQQIAK